MVPVHMAVGSIRWIEDRVQLKQVPWSVPGHLMKGQDGPETQLSWGSGD